MQLPQQAEKHHESTEKGATEGLVDEPEALPLGVDVLCHFPRFSMMFSSIFGDFPRCFDDFRRKSAVFGRLRTL